MYQANITQRKITFTGQNGPKHLHIDYDKQLKRVLMAYTEEYANGPYTAGCVVLPYSRGFIIDAGDGDKLLFDINKEVFYISNTSGHPESFGSIVDDSGGAQGGDLESLMSNLLD